MTGDQKCMQSLDEKEIIKTPLAEKRKVLLISYLFPPLGGSGSSRPLKMAKYLPKYGWKPVVLTVKNPDWYYAHDPELLKQLSKEVEVLRSQMFRSTWIYRCLNPLRTKRMEGLIRRYLFHPDEQIGWLPFAYRSATQFMNNHKIHALYSTSGPMTCHLIAMLLKRRFGIPWVAEFRDEWFEAPNLPLPTNLHKKMHYYLEKLVVKESDRILTLAPEFAKLLLKHGVIPDKFTTIVKGYDPDDLSTSTLKESNDENRFTVVFTGLIYESFPPNRLLSAVNSLIKDGCISPKKIIIRFVGANVINRALDPFRVTECTGFVPQTEAISSLFHADLLLLLLSRERGSGVIPSKIFEYMAAGKPILALVPPEGAVSGIIQKTKTGTVVDFEDEGGIRRSFFELYSRWETGSLNLTPDWHEIGRFDQRLIFREISTILDELTGVDRR